MTAPLKKTNDRGRDKKKRREARLSAFFIVRGLRTALETETEGDWDIACLLAVLGEDVEAVAVGIAVGEGAFRVERVDVAPFHKEAGGSKA